MRMTRLYVIPSLLCVLIGCGRAGSFEEEDFEAVMTTLARAWSRQNTDLALSVFHVDAVYMEPPDIQLYVGHEQLRPYFAALEPGTVMRFETLLYDTSTGIGAGEYVFGHEESEKADVGVAIVVVEEGKIKHWREYQRKGPSNFERFISTQDKDWKWHIGNYPAAEQ